MTTAYDSAWPRPGPTQDVREMWRHRDLLVLLIARNIKNRYKRSVLGLAWTMLNPLLTMVVLALVFSNLFAPAVSHYPIYLLSGLVLWNFVAQATTAAMNDLVWHSSLLKRVYVPRAIFAVAAVGTGLVNLGLALIPLGLVALATGVPLKPAILIMPLVALLAAMFALGVGLFVSTLAVYYTDVIDTYRVILTAWLYLTPVFYPASIVPDGVARWLQYNPMTHIVECFRAPLYRGELPEVHSLLVTLMAALISMGLGWFGLV